MKQHVKEYVIIHRGTNWRKALAGLDVTGRGPQRALDGPMTAFFASRRCTGHGVRLGLEWALSQARHQHPVISGFQSPLERSVLDLLLEAQSPAVVVLARPVETAHLPGSWSKAVEQQHLTVISATSTSRQMDRQRASARNEIVARLANSITVAHATPGGRLEAQIKSWSHQGLAVNILDAPS